MAVTIAFVVQKGGTGKTTTTNITAELLHKKGARVLVVDLDPQNNLSHSVGVNNPETSICDVLTDSITIDKAIYKSQSGYAVLPASRKLFEHQADIAATSLAKHLEPLQALFDYILIDCPPALSSLSINGIMAADKIVIPVIPGNFCDLAVADTLRTISTLQQDGHKVQTAGILIITFNNRSTLDRYMLEQYESIAKEHSTKVFSTKIRQCQKIKEAQVLGQSLLQYAPKSNAVIDYKAFVKELTE